MPRPVLNKIDFYRRYKKGEFGNRIRDWSTYEEMVASGYTGRFAIRTSTPGGPFICNILVADGWLLRDDLVDIGIPLTSLNYSEHTDYKHFLIQGEVLSGRTGLSSTLTTAGIPMRIALTDPTYRSQITKHGHAATRIILRQYLDDPSYENMDRLLTDFPDHVVEFTTTDEPQGLLGWNTVFWEVRKY